MNDFKMYLSGMPIEHQTKKVELDKLLELTKIHKSIMDDHNILVSVYTNASGFLWSMMMVDSGTDLGYSEYSGNCLDSGSFVTYIDALDHALCLIQQCNLEQFRKEVKASFHWGNYADHLITNYTKLCREKK